MDEHTNSTGSLEEIAFKWMFYCGILDSLHEQCLRYKNENSEMKMVRIPAVLVFKKRI
jgi:hypothetical protein